MRGALVDRCHRCNALLVRMQPEQHGAMQAVYEDLAALRDWPIGSGTYYDAWQWHQLVLFAFAKEMGWDPVLAPALDGGGMVMVMRQKQSRLTKKQGSELIEWAKAWATTHGVQTREWDQDTGELITKAALLEPARKAA
jgi:hypothetical protein